MNSACLCNLTHDKLNISKLSCQHMACTNVNAKKKDYKKCDNCHNDPKYEYSQLYYYKKPSLLITTPVMLCPFGINVTNNNFSMCLQFTNYMEDPLMKSFYDFIQTTEYRQMELLGLGEDDEDDFISQIKYDKQGKYDPNLHMKLPFAYNKFNIEVFNEAGPFTNIMHIPRFAKMRCDIYLDKVWKFNDKFISKWKVKKINLV